ncbi:unnamed protein product [Miscanthus lutarioriparius]|uniref:Ubiquitin-like protease family profile domain-containing protein n=1 Tax=Miscanthus lutarioriparius TaxID=422564 RepID=A0A811QP56_9POAL|nr:unnamed protein product [Miscanthus lutarioriparius]
MMRVLFSHLEMMQKFINFCKEKKVKYVQELPDKTKLNLHEENEVVDELYIVHEKSPSTNGDNGKHVASDKGRHHYEDVRISVPAMPMNLKSKPNRFISELHVPAVPSLQAPIAKPIKDVSPECCILKETKSKGCLDLGKLADQLYNQKNVNIVKTKNITHAVEVFHVFRFVLCSLEGVKLFRLVLHIILWLFDDSHPRQSRKHFFYPRIGGSLLSYRPVFEANTVKDSFLGANSALKLHLADKLCFPIFHAHVKHWFVFIVDLRLSKFVFLDSMFGENDSLQIHTRASIIPAFKECWYEHAEVKLDLEDFSVLYPPVPKQNNIHDCGIFAIMFMELWDNSVDLRRVFDQSDIPNIRVKGTTLYPRPCPRAQIRARILAHRFGCPRVCGFFLPAGDECGDVSAFAKHADL